MFENKTCYLLVFLCPTHKKSHNAKMLKEIYINVKGASNDEELRIFQILETDDGHTILESQLDIKHLSKMREGYVGTVPNLEILMDTVLMSVLCESDHI